MENGTGTGTTTTHVTAVNRKDGGMMYHVPFLRPDKMPCRAPQAPPALIFVSLRRDDGTSPSARGTHLYATAHITP